MRWRVLKLEWNLQRLHWMTVCSVHDSRSHTRNSATMRQHIRVMGGSGSGRVSKMCKTLVELLANLKENWSC